jgi:sugar/nucleoside kinase (ribokinase family)
MSRHVEIHPIKNYMDQTCDLLVAGEINPDLILSGDVIPAFGQVEKLVDSAVLVPGSSAVITASAAARLGLRTAFTGICGDDLFGKFMLVEMKRLGLDTSSVIVDPNLSTGLTVILNRVTGPGAQETGKASGGHAGQADRAMLTLAGAMNALRAGDIRDDLLRQAHHLHAASFFLQTSLQPGLPDLFRRAHNLNLTTSLDTNWDPSERWAGLQEVLPLCDVLLLNSSEAMAVSGAPDVEQAAMELAGSCKVAVVKLGAQGAIARRGQALARSPALELKVVDTVGAGDTFNGGFLYGFLKGWSLERSLRLAVVCGSLSTRAAGGTAAQPTLDEALRHVEPAG